MSNIAIKLISSKELNKRNILISMTECGDPLGNALAERVNGILKAEWLDKRPLRNWSEAQAYVEQIIGLYNSLRPHQSLSFLAPDRGITAESRTNASGKTVEIESCTKCPR